MFLITEKGVDQISCEKIGKTVHSEQFLVTLSKEDEHLEQEVPIRFGKRVLGPMNPISEEDKLKYAMRAAVRTLKSGQSVKEVFIDWHNIASFQGNKATDDEIDSKLMILIRKFFMKYPKKTLSQTDIFVSTDFYFQKIVNRLDYFVACDIIKYSSLSGDEYELKKGGFEVIEKLQQSSKVSPLLENRYFQLVSLSNKVKEPFVFVLMPFKQEEFNQKVYSDVIKPTVEKELGICCIRSDEETKPGVINNQIYTMIRKAKLIIAETTSRNPNVFYEVGMAHAFNKDVFIFNSSKKNKKLPFDIITNRAVFYNDYEDLKKKLVENLKDHVS